MTSRADGAAPRISIVIPTFNRAHLVSRAIESALAQTAIDQCEILVVDDGGADTTAQVVTAYGERVRLIRRANGGLAAARNSGIAAAQGEFIALLDDDDAWRRGKLAAQLAAMARFPEVALCTTRTHDVDCTGREVLRRIAPIELDMPVDCLAHLLDWNFVPPSSALIRRSALEKVGAFDESLRQAEDFDLWARLAARAPFICLVEPLTLYAAATPDSLSRSTLRQLGYELKVRRRMRHLANTAQLRQAWRRGWLRCLTDLRDAAHRRAEYRLAARAAWSAALADPIGRKRWEWRRLFEDSLRSLAPTRPAAPSTPPAAARAPHRSASSG